MLALVVTWGLSALALRLSSEVFKNVELEGGILTALWVAALFSILSYFLGWLIFGFLGVATLGLGFVFHFVTHLLTAAIVLKLTSAVSSRFDIKGFLPALGTAGALALASAASRELLAGPLLT